MTTSAPGSDPQPTPSTNAYRSTNAGPNKNANTGTSAEDRTPQAVLQQLLDGNDRFVQGKALRPHQDRDRLSSLTQGQAPKAVVLACSDSRVPVELLFDQGFGDVFVIRTAGEIVDMSVLASLEFAVEGLGVSLVVVLGHERVAAPSKPPRRPCLRAPSRNPSSACSWRRSRHRSWLRALRGTPPPMTTKSSMCGPLLITWSVAVRKSQQSLPTAPSALSVSGIYWKTAR